MTIKDVGYGVMLAGALAGSAAIDEFGISDPEVIQEIVVDSAQVDSVKTETQAVEPAKIPDPIVKEVRFEGKNDRIDRYQRDSFRKLNWDVARMTNGQMVAKVTGVLTEVERLKSENEELKSDLAKISSAYKKESSRRDLYETEYHRLQELIHAKRLP